MPLDDLDSMVTRAALVTRPGWNRRFHDYLFYVEGFTVVDFTRVDKLDECGTMAPTPKSGEFLVYEECPLCDGEGCQSCKDGQVAVIRKS